MNQNYYKKSIIFAVILHIAVFMLLFASLDFSTLPQPVVADKSESEIVQANTVDQKQVEQEIQKIKAEQQAKRDAEIARQKKLEQLAQAAKQARVKEQQRLARLEMQRRQLEHQHEEEQQAAEEKLEQMKKQQELAKQQLADMQKQREQLTEKEKAKADAKTLAEQKLEQQIDAEQKQIQSAHFTQIQSEVEKYKALILNAIGQRWIMPEKLDEKLSAQVLINLAPGGTVLSVSLLKNSGNPLLDNSVITAIWKASPLPVPTDAEVFNQFRELHLTVRPEGLLG